KGFQKIFLKKGESKQVSFTIDVDKLKFYNDELKYIYEPGDFKVYIGSNSQDVKEAAFKLEAWGFSWNFFVTGRGTYGIIFVSLRRNVPFGTGGRLHVQSSFI